MTSQVAVSNCYGVAVASDTVSSRDTRGGTKTVGHTNKIYEIGPGHKVLVLHAGCTVTNEVPTKLYVVEWAKTLESPLPTLQDYISNFLDWIRGPNSLHSPESEKDFLTELLRMHFRTIYNMVRSRLSDYERENPNSSITEDVQRQTLRSALSDALTALQTQEMLEGLDLNIAKQSLDSVGEEYAKAIDYWIGEFGVDDSFSDLLTQSTLEAIVRADGLSDNDSFLSFVGFGSDEIFPSNQQIACRGFAGSKLYFRRYELQSILPGSNASGIAFFAQRDAIQSFLQGYHGATLSEMENAFRFHTNEIAKDTISDEQTDAIIEKSLSQVRDYAYNRFVEPLWHEIEGMTNARLCDFAEALVGLQATAANSQDGPATVGGFIEVAMIDRQHGITWVKSLTSHVGVR